MKTLVLLLVLVGCSWADSIKSVSALQEPEGVTPSYANSTNVLLGDSMPLLSPTLFSQHLFKGSPAYLAFSTLLAPVTGRIELTLTIGGVTYVTGGFLNSTGSSVDSFVLPRGFYHPTEALLSVHFNGETKEYRFQFVEPVPEPGTWLTLGTGLAMIWRRLHV